MSRLRYHPAALLTFVIAVAAIAGYLAGHRTPPRPHPERLLTASAGGILLDYPASWQPTSSAMELHGLFTQRLLALAPGGDANRAELLVGQIAGSEQAPLPQAFVASMRATPRTEVVDLVGNQAYRYSGVQLTGVSGQLTLYTIPNANGSPTALACYASSPEAAQMRSCERIAATLTLIQQSQSDSLTPSPEYAQQLTAAVAALEQRRVAIRAQLSAHATLATLSHDGEALAAAYASAGSALSPLQPQLSTQRAQAALSAAIAQAHTAYTALASAARASDYVSLATARTQVYEAEGAVNAALESFSLLGYGRT